MAKNHTTFAAAVGISDETVTLTSGTGVVDGAYIYSGGELMQITKGNTAATTTPRVKRGVQGTAPKAFVILTPCTVLLATDLPDTTPQQEITYPQLMTYKFDTYAASGAIEFGKARRTYAQILGTSALAMTLASPSIDQNGLEVVVIGAAKSASTLTVNDGTTGIGNAGSGYDVLTAQNAGNVMKTFVACNGFWLTEAPLTGTVTALTFGIA